MAIKSKGWTARLPVKICCVSLTVAMAFTFLLGFLGIARMNLNGIDEGFLFADFNNPDYFFDRYALSSQSMVQTVFGYQSEENIKDMGCLEWVRDEANSPQAQSYASTTITRNSAFSTTATNNSAYSSEAVVSPDESGEVWMKLVSKNLTNQQSSWGSVPFSQLDGQEAGRLVDQAIENQIQEYRGAKKWLETTPGLYYHITDGERVLTNAPDWDVNDFRMHYVYIIESGDSFEQSRTDVNNRYNGYWNNGYWSNGYWHNSYWKSSQDRTVYIAFSNDAVNYQNGVWKVLQRQFAANVAIIAGSAVVALAAIIILMVGAGRRRADGGEAVRFMTLDKPWLDITLYAVIAFEAAICSFMYFSMDNAWQYGNIRAIVMLCALLAVCFTLPVLWWILSFTKRCKAGKWWRHTALYWFWDKCVSSIKSLWAGVPLTAKAVTAGIILFMAMAISGSIGFNNHGSALVFSFVFAVAVTVFIMRYARKLHLVEQGAKAASNGIYDAPVAVKRGELGSIAASINSISDGINSAVAGRMKSERLKTELITNVSHDIRTPLTSLITYTDLLKNEGLGSERAPEYLEVLIQKSARLKTLTDDLFEAAKAASGSIETHLVALDLSDFVRQVLGELDERVAASGLDFRVNLPERAPVTADGKLMWRVMENLLSNVFKYALKSSRVYIEVEADGSGYRLDVKNISEHELNVDPGELTERFKRGDGARAGEGSGLGLAIAQSFVEAQGGRFELSIDGDLFKATVYLPGA